MLWDDIALNRTQAKHSDLFDGLRLCWSAPLGITGDTLQAAFGNTTGTFSGATASQIWQRKKSRLCLDFDGLDDEALIEGRSGFELGTNFTMSIWWRTNAGSLSSNNPIISSVNYYQTGNGVFIFRPSSTTNLQFASYDLGATNLEYLSNCPVPNVGLVWHHTILHCDGSTLRVQHDGKALVSSVSHTKAIQDLTFGLRFSDDHNNNKINGSIAETAFWSRELSRSQRQKLWVFGPGDWMARKQRRIYSVPGLAFRAAWATRSTTIAGVPSGA